MFSYRWLFLTILLLVSCSGNQESNFGERKDQTLYLNVYTEPPTLDPGKASDTTSGSILALLFEGLMRISKEGVAEPAIAQSLDISEDGTVYTFHLKKSFWSNNTPLTAHDFVYAWNRVLDPSFPAGMAYQFYFIKNAQGVKEGKLSKEKVGFRAIDDFTLEVELKDPTPFFPQMLATIPAFLPINRSIDVNDPNWSYDAGKKFTSNGPFLLKKWKHHNVIVLKPNPHYWDRSHIRLKGIMMSMIEDANTELSLFEDGEIDVTGRLFSIGIPTDALPTLQEEGRLKTYPMAATYFYLFNTESPPFNNVKIRRAFAMALDRSAIVKYITQSGEEPALGILPRTMQLNKGGYFTDHHVEEARRLFAEGMKELGLKRANLPQISLSYNTSEAHHKIAQTVQEQWSKVFGIKVVLENLEWKVYLDKLSHNDFSIARISWQASYNDPMSFLGLFKYKNTAINHSNWENPEFVRLLEASQKTLDRQKRQEILMKAEKLLMDEMPIIPLYYLTNSYMINPRLKGYTFTPLGEVNFRHAYFEE